MANIPSFFSATRSNPAVYKRQRRSVSVRLVQAGVLACVWMAGLVEWAALLRRRWVVRR